MTESGGRTHRSVYVIQFTARGTTVKTMATDRLKEMLDPAWLKLNADGTLNTIDWVKAEVLAEEWKAGTVNPSTSTAAVVIAIRDHLKSRG